jgi:hypothetical protein
LSQTFKEKLAALEEKRQFEQDHLESISNTVASDEQASVDTNQVLTESSVSSLKIKRTTLAIFASLFVIVIAQLYALGKFDTIHHVTQPSLDGNFTYDGGLINGQFSGDAKITDRLGNSLVTQFKAGKIVGPLTYMKTNAYTVSQSKDQVTIKFANQQVVQQDQSRYLLTSPNFSYQGSWRFAGVWQGKMTFANGAVYDGMWRNGLPDGKGTYTPLTGTPLAGEFKLGALTK